MQEQKNENEKDSPQPFIILKNVRKDFKKKSHIRKQSYQYPKTIKKTRKMTIELQHGQALSQEQRSQKYSSDYIEMEEQNNPNEQNNQQEIINISQVPQCREQQQQIEVQDKLPFNCNEWQLDKQSPYLKICNTISIQIDQLKLDE